MPVALSFLEVKGVLPGEVLKEFSLLDRLYSGVAVSDSEEDDMHLQSAESSEVQMDRNMSNVRYGASFMRGEPPDYSPPDASEDFEEVADAARRM